MNSLSRATAVVTGAARRIGRAIAVRLGQDDAHALAVDIEDGSEAVTAVESAGGSGEFRKGDLTDEAALVRVFADLDLDILVNNAGHYAPSRRR